MQPHETEALERLRTGNLKPPKHSGQVGRPPIAEPARFQFMLNLTQRERALIRELGGSTWVRRKLQKLLSQLE